MDTNPSPDNGRGFRWLWLSIVLIVAFNVTLCPRIADAQALAAPLPDSIVVGQTVNVQAAATDAIGRPASGARVIVVPHDTTTIAASYRGDGVTRLTGRTPGITLVSAVWDRSDGSRLYVIDAVRVVAPSVPPPGPVVPAPLPAVVGVDIEPATSLTLTLGDSARLRVTRAIVVDLAVAFWRRDATDAELARLGAAGRIQWTARGVTVRPVGDGREAVVVGTEAGIGSVQGCVATSCAFRGVTVAPPVPVPSDTTPTPIPVPVPPDTVTPPPADTIRGPARLPELPRVVPDATAPVVTGRTIRPATADALQAALDTAQAGDEIVLAPGALYAQHNITYRRAHDSGYVLLRSDVPLPAGRATPTISTTFARIANTVPSEPAFSVAPGAAGLYVAGVRFANDTTRTQGTIVAVGSSGAEQDSVAKAPDRIVLDRVHVYGGSDNNVQRCVGAHTRSFALVRSWIADCHAFGYDSQALWIANGPGPYLVEDNFLEGAGENFMSGGADPRAESLMPHDITFRGNHVYTPRIPRWLPTREDTLAGYVLRDSAGVPLRWVQDSAGAWVVSDTGKLRSSDERRFSRKNLFELKIGRRVLVERNVFENAWPDAQTGFAILLKSTNQQGRATWSETADVTFRLNHVLGATSALSLAGSPEKPAVKANTMLFEHNLFETRDGRLLQLGDVADVTVRRNTAIGTQQALIIIPPLIRFTFTGNLIRAGTYGVLIDGGGTLAAAIPGGTIAGNVIATSHRANLFAGNLWPGLLPLPETPADLAALAARFPAVGADLAAVRAATAGVVIPPQ